MSRTTAPDVAAGESKGLPGRLTVRTPGAAAAALVRYAAMSAAVAVAASPAPAAAQDGTQDWPSYNRTLGGDRYSPLAEINRQTVSKLKVACTYDTGLTTSFQTGMIVSRGVMYFTTEKDTFAIDAAACALKWRRTEDYAAVSPLQVNRGAALLGKRLFRGTEDGRVLAYDLDSGAVLWSQKIGKDAFGETTPAAPIAWDGKVFIGVAGGDNKGMKGRIYALDAATGAIIWTFNMVPDDKAPLDDPDRRTWGNAPGAPITGGGTWTSYTLDTARGLLYVPGGNPAPDFLAAKRPGANRHTSSIVVLDARTGGHVTDYPMIDGDFHDWDASATPILVTLRSGRRLPVDAIKDGNLYGFDLSTGARLYRRPVTTIENAEAPITPTGTRFCPGTQGGSEWNGPAYDPRDDTVYTGAVDWCVTATLADDASIAAVAAGQPWAAEANENHKFGVFDPVSKWAGWVYATDPLTGGVKWRRKLPAPILAAVTPTAGGLVMTGDMAGNFYALDSSSGKSLFTSNLNAALAGGVVTYEAGGKQRIAIAAGMTSIIWKSPAPPSTAKIVVFDLP